MQRTWLSSYVEALILLIEARYLGSRLLGKLSGTADNTIGNLWYEQNDT